MSVSDPSRLSLGEAVGAVPDLIRATFARFGSLVAEQAVRVAKCESGFSPTARLGPNVGVFQLNGSFHRARAARLGFTWEQMTQAGPNIAVAADLYGDSGWGPWSWLQVGGMSDLTREEAVELVVRLIGGAIRPNIYRLADDTFVACLAVDPDIAFDAIRIHHATPRGTTSG